VSFFHSFLELRPESQPKQPKKYFLDKPDMTAVVIPVLLPSLDMKLKKRKKCRPEAALQPLTNLPAILARSDSFVNRPDSSISVAFSKHADSVISSILPAQSDKFTIHNNPLIRLGTLGHIIIVSIRNGPLNHIHPLSACHSTISAEFRPIPYQPIDTIGTIILPGGGSLLDSTVGKTLFKKNFINPKRFIHYATLFRALSRSFALFRDKFLGGRQTVSSRQTEASTADSLARFAPSEYA
jgi:hypothetical protein